MQDEATVNVTAFKHKHYSMLIDMLAGRESDLLGFTSYKSLPKIGYIAMLGKEPVAAGFLRRVEGGYAQLDTFASNPYFGGKIRDEGIRKVTSALMEDAADLKLVGILAITKDDGIFRRAKDQGFQVINQLIMGKILD